MATWATWEEVWDQISHFFPGAATLASADYDMAINDALTFGFSEDGYWSMLWAVSTTWNLLYTMLGFYDTTDILGFDIYAAIFYAKSGGVDLGSINQAMKEGTFAQIRDNLSLQWAFQQIMFDQPFFPEEYTALVEYLRT